MPVVNPVYNGQPQTATPVVRGVGGVALTPFNVLYNGSTTPPVNAGTYSIEVQFAGNANYTALTATGTFAIDKAMPALTATGGQFTYDAQPHAGSGAAVGVFGETLSPVRLSMTVRRPLRRPTRARTPCARPMRDRRTTTPRNQRTRRSRSTAPRRRWNSPRRPFRTRVPRSATVYLSRSGWRHRGRVPDSYDGSPTAPTDAGSYAVHAQFAGNTNYEPLSATTTFVITKAWPRFPTLNNLTFTYDGQPHPGYNLPVWGVFNEPLTPLTTTYNGSTTPPVTVGVYTAVLRYDGSANYEADSRTYTLTILVGTPLLTWEPDSLTYGQGLGGAQLDAIANVPGTFVYNPPAGTILSAGFLRPLFVTFTPDDSVNYRTTSIVRDITVFRAHPQIVWAAPANIVFGTALSATQLSATANTAGTFVYNHQVGAVLSAGQWTLSATFTPVDWANYYNENISVPLTVVKATPVVSWNPPSDIVYGTALGAAQLTRPRTCRGRSRIRRRRARCGMRDLTRCRSRSRRRMRELHQRYRRGDAECRQGNADDRLGEPGGYRLRHGAQRHAVECDGERARHVQLSPAAGTVLSAGAQTFRSRSRRPFRRTTTAHRRVSRSPLTRRHRPSAGRIRRTSSMAPRSAARS